MKKERLSKAGTITAIIVSALFLTAIFAVTMDFNADDAQGYNWVYQRYELGERPADSNLFNPMLALLSFLHIFHIGVNGVWLCTMYYACWYFGCVAVTLSMSLRNVKSNRWWLLLMEVFMLLPSTRTNRYHLIPTFMSLLILYFMIEYKESGKKPFIILSAAITLYTLMTVNDRVLFVLFIPVPVMVYWIVWSIQKKERRKYLYFVSLLCAFAVSGAKILDIVLKAVQGNGLGIFASWDGYGGGDDALWIDIGAFFDKAIPSFFSALMYQYNIPAQGGFIQALSFFWVIRIFMAGLCLTAWLAYLRDIVKKGVDNVEMIDSLSAVTVSVLTLINLLNGNAARYMSGVDGWPINRYNSIAWFLLMIMLVHWIDKKDIGMVSIHLPGGRKISSEGVLTAIFICLTVGYAVTTQTDEKKTCKAEVDFLEENSYAYQYGLASYWKAFPVTAQTNGRYVVCHGMIRKDAADHSIRYLQCNNDFGNFVDGSNVFNYIISDLGNTMTLDEQNINDIRGDYIDKNVVGNSEIYLYDYDIRWTPRLIMEAVGEDYELVEDIAYYFDFPVGTNRIEMDVANSSNFVLEISENEDVDNVVITGINDNKIYVDLVCRQNTNVTLKVARKEDEVTTIHKIVLKRVKGAVEVTANEMYLKEGSYIVTINGDNLKRADAVFEGTDISVRRLTDGRIKNRYQIDVAVPQTIRFEITGSDISIDKIFYENTDLLDENSIDKDAEYHWNI